MNEASSDCCSVSSQKLAFLVYRSHTTGIYPSRIHPRRISLAFQCIAVPQAIPHGYCASRRSIGWRDHTLCRHPLRPSKLVLTLPWRQHYSPRIGSILDTGHRTTIEIFMSALGPDAFEVVEAPKGSVKRKSREKQTLESSLEAKYEQGESSGLNAASVESKTSKQSMKGNTMEPLASNFEHLDFDVAAVEATVGTQEVEQSEDGDDGFSALENELLEEMAPATLRWEKADETKKDLHGRPRLDTEAQRLRDSLASGKREEGEQLLRECAEIDQANPDAQPPRLLILVGIPGSGKTTFGRRLQEQGWERVSQDELGNRFRCEVELIRALAKGKNVVLDRCNFDEEQRYPWVRLGLLRGCHVGAIVFAVPLQQCVDRVLSRENHETLPSSPKAASIVNRFASMFRPPAQEEGISFCRYLRTEDDAERVIDEVSR